VTGEVAGVSECEPGCAIQRVLLGPSSRSLQDKDDVGTATFVLSFSGSGIDNLSDAQVSELIKDGEETIKAILVDEGIEANIDFDGLAVVEPPAEPPSYSTKKGGKKGKKDKKGGKSAKKKKSSSSKSSKKKSKKSKSEKKGKKSYRF